MQNHLVSGKMVKTYSDSLTTNCIL